MQSGQNVVKVRVATLADVAAVDALLARSYPRLLRPDYQPSVMVLAVPLISRAKPALVTCGTYFVVELGGAIIGSGGWTLAHPGGGRTAQGTANVRHVVTDHRSVRRGVGRALIAHILSTARLAGVTRLECLSTLTAVPFYQAMGFVSRGPLIIALAPGIDFPAVSMARDI